MKALSILNIVLVNSSSTKQKNDFYYTIVYQSANLIKIRLFDHLFNFIGLFIVEFNEELYNAQ